MQLSLLRTQIQFDDLWIEIPFEQRSVVVYGKTHPQPRLTKWYGPKPYTYSGLTWPACEMPELIEELRQAVERATGEQFNSCLCNFYRDGSDRIHWHSDDEPEFGSNAAVASLSFGAARTFKMRKKDRSSSLSFELGDRTLLFMPRGIQQVWEHTVPKTAKPVGKRINLTFRNMI